MPKIIIQITILQHNWILSVDCSVRKQRFRKDVLCDGKLVVSDEYIFFFSWR